MAKKARRPWSQTKVLHNNSRQPVTLVMDTVSATEAVRLDGQLRRAPETERPTLAQRIRTLEQRAAESEEQFVFGGLGRERHELLVAAHPPTEEQMAAAPAGMVVRWNSRTFPPALMALCCVEPRELHAEVTDDGEPDPAVLAEWTEIHTTWSDGQVSALWTACLAAQQGVVEAPKSRVASAVLRSLEQP